jgi:hypothetical protein
MNNIEQYKNRFFNLMESTIGDVKPLISEQTDTIDELTLDTLTLSLKQIETFLNIHIVILVIVVKVQLLTNQLQYINGISYMYLENGYTLPLLELLTYIMFIL